MKQTENEYCDPIHIHSMISLSLSPYFTRKSMTENKWSIWQELQLQCWTTDFDAKFFFSGSVSLCLLVSFYFNTVCTNHKNFVTLCCINRCLEWDWAQPTAYWIKYLMSIYWIPIALQFQLLLVTVKASYSFFFSPQSLNGCSKSFDLRKELNIYVDKFILAFHTCQKFNCNGKKRM